MLIGIELHLPGQRPRFVGKVAESPYIEGAPWLTGRRIFYREHPEAQLLSRRYDALSVDDAALGEAFALGAVALVCYATDTKRLYIVDQAACARAVRASLGDGEGLQVRIPRAWCLSLPVWGGLGLGYATQAVAVTPRPQLRQEALFG